MIFICQKLKVNDAILYWCKSLICNIAFLCAVFFFLLRLISLISHTTIIVYRVITGGFKPSCFFRYHRFTCHISFFKLYKCVSTIGPGSAHAFSLRSMASKIFRLGPNGIPADFKSLSVHNVNACISMLSRFIVIVNCSKLSDAKNVMSDANFGSLIWGASSLSVSMTESTDLLDPQLYLELGKVDARLLWLVKLPNFCIFSIEVKLFPRPSNERTAYGSFGRPTKLPLPERMARGPKSTLALSKLLRLLDLPPFIESALADLVLELRKVWRTDPCTLLGRLFCAERTDVFPVLNPVICEKCSKLCVRLMLSTPLLFVALLLLLRFRRLFFAINVSLGIFSLLLLLLTLTPFCFFTRFA